MTTATTAATTTAATTTTATATTKQIEYCYYANRNKVTVTTIAAATTITTAATTVTTAKVNKNKNKYMDDTARLQVLCLLLCNYIN